jgi:hypothetical protein
MTRCHGRPTRLSFKYKMPLLQQPNCQRPKSSRLPRREGRTAHSSVTPPASPTSLPPERTRNDTTAWNTCHGDQRPVSDRSLKAASGHRALYWHNCPMAEGTTKGETGNLNEPSPSVKRISKWRDKAPRGSPSPPDPLLPKPSRHTAYVTSASGAATSAKLPTAYTDSSGAFAFRKSPLRRPDAVLAAPREVLRPEWKLALIEPDP